MACTVKCGPLDGSFWASCPSDGAIWEAMNMIVCRTPWGRSGTREIWLEIAALNQEVVSDCRKLDSVGSKTALGVLAHMSALVNSKWLSNILIDDRGKFLLELGLVRRLGYIGVECKIRYAAYDITQDAASDDWLDA